MHLSFALYRSEARSKLDEELILDILTESVHSNAREGITGFLHVDRNIFLQYLEGPHGPLMRKLARIRKDRRHRKFLILADGTIDERFFPGWDMGHLSSDLLPTDGLLGRKTWLGQPVDIDPLPLIQAFAKHAGQLDRTDITSVA
ncbi:BLUF domain-containing protein [Aestuariivita sp.]|jgi:hypothetical protein|uniref:BLUF domain-containing protein n=1 Tax=Aestuariivita sp. TaxID=1872407 RepID=UPI0021736430|nr:BLUF domain-containing protein [Aestuariivita sp.]MCE8009256.1 BLUF domain-containing protein [Aestuariivita sp.]